MSVDPGINETAQMWGWQISSAPRSRQGVAWMLAAGGAMACAFGLSTSIVLLNVGLGALVAAALVSWPNLQRMPGFWWAALVAISMILINMVHRRGQFFYLPGWSYSWPVLYLLACILRNEKTLGWFLRVFWVAGMLALGLGIAQFSIGLDDTRPPFRISASGDQFTRATGWFSHHLRFGFAMVCVTLTGFLLVSWRRSSSCSVPAVPLNGFFIASLLLAGWTGTLISSARGQFLALSAGLFVWFLASGWRASRVRFSLLVIALVGSGLISWLMFPQRIGSAMSGHDPRWEVWSMAIQVIAEHPILGVGIGGFGPAIQQLIDSHQLVVKDPWAADPGHAHNSFLSLMVCFGVPVFVLFIGWMTAILRSILRLDPIARAFGSSIFTAMCIGGMTEDLAGLATSRYAFFVMVSLTWGVAEVLKAHSLKSRVEGLSSPHWHSAL